VRSRFGEGRHSKLFDPVVIQSTPRSGDEVYLAVVVQAAYGKRCFTGYPFTDEDVAFAVEKINGFFVRSYYSQNFLPVAERKELRLYTDVFGKSIGKQKLFKPVKNFKLVVVNKNEVFGPIAVKIVIQKIMVRRKRAETCKPEFPAGRNIHQFPGSVSRKNKPFVVGLVDKISGMFRLINCRFQINPLLSFPVNNLNIIGIVVDDNVILSIGKQPYNLL